MSKLTFVSRFNALLLAQVRLRPFIVYDPMNSAGTNKKHAQTKTALVPCEMSAKACCSEWAKYLVHTMGLRIVVSLRKL